VPIDHLPVRLRPAAERVKSFLMTDAAVLLVLGAECAARGASYLQHPPSSHPIEKSFDIGVWAVIWTAIGVACLAAASRHHSMAANAAFSAAVGLNAMWAGSILIGSIQADQPDAPGWGGAGVYAGVATLALWSVWRGSRTEIRVREVGR
jgi:hypothetical protein